MSWQIISIGCLDLLFSLDILFLWLQSHITRVTRTPRRPRTDHVDHEIFQWVTRCASRSWGPQKLRSRTFRTVETVATFFPKVSASAVDLPACDWFFLTGPEHLLSLVLCLFCDRLVVLGRRKWEGSTTVEAREASHQWLIVELLERVTLPHCSHES